MNLKFFACAFFLTSFLCAKEPDALYLTWVEDPSSTMTAVWLTAEDEKASEVFFKAAGQKSWRQAKGWVQEAVGTGLWVHAATMQGLLPDALYVFKVGQEGEEHAFQTMPKELSRQVRFAVGGDAYMKQELFVPMCKAIAQEGVDFAVIGGDIAYTIGEKKREKSLKAQGERWAEFFALWKRQMQTKEGKMIPLLAAVGNHDVPKGQADPQKEPVLFYAMFPLPEKDVSYRAVDFGSYLSLFLLDTGHTYPVAGGQTGWLEQALEKRKGVRHLFPIYHVAAYPSFYPFEAKISEQVRTWWVPLFEKAGVKVAFENHNHTYKRSHPLLGGKKNEKGIVYLGDGAWGVPPRPLKEDRWYLARALSASNYFLVILEEGKCRIEPRGKEGLIDDIVMK